MDNAKLRAWWWRRQGFDELPASESPAAILARTGWARSVGGCGPYLTLFARGGISRQGADEAVAKLTIHELPSARGCTYVLPASDFALGLKLAQASGDGEIKVAEKLGVTAKEIDKLCDAVVGALEKGPLGPDGIREATGKAARSLGEAGKKKGLTTTLPVALGRLQTAGEIRRVPVNGRLDQQRFKYTLWRTNPLRNSKMSSEEVPQEIARRFFAWIGPATVAEFQAFAGVTMKAAKAAVEPLKLEPIAADSDRMLLPADRVAFEAFRPSKEPLYALVSNLDSMFLLRRELKTLLDPKDMDREVVTDKGCGALGSLMDLPSPAILDRGRIVGLWEYDPETESIAWAAFVKKDRALQDAVSRMQDYVQTQLGDARSFSLDSPKSRKPRIEGLRKE
jgi:hypothetical protein